MTNLDRELDRILSCNGGNDLDNLLASIPDYDDSGDWRDLDLALDDDISDLDSISIDDILR